MKKFLLTATILVAGIYEGAAQGGSNYSSLGMGDIRRTIGASYDALAGTSIAMPTHHGINIVNPALLGQISSTRLQAGYRFSQSLATSGTVSQPQNNGEIDGVLGLFSIDTAYSFGMTLGLIPVTSVNYGTRHPLQTDMNGIPVTGRSTRTGQGGTSALVLGAGGRVFGNVTLGLMVEAMFGTSMYSDQVVVDGANYFAIASSTVHDMRGVTTRAGLYVPINEQLSIGAILATGPQATVYTTNRVVALGSGSVVSDTTRTSEASTSLPFTVGIGASWKTGKFRFGADLETSNYSSVRFNTRPDVSLGSSIHASIAVSRPGSDVTSAPYFEQWGFHGGIGYDKSYITYNGSSIADAYASFGIDFPAGGAAIVDAAIQGGMRMVSSTSALQEAFGRVTFTLSIGESWFKPLARD